MNDSDSPKSKRRRNQCCLRTLLLSVIVGFQGCGGRGDLDPVTALQNAGATIERDEHGEVVKVSLNSLDITDAELRHLSGLTNLQSLSLNSFQITDAGLEHLKGLNRLEHLSFFSCHRISDTGLEHLKELTNLSSLSLMFCSNITDAGLVHVKELTKLSSLILMGCTRIKDAGLEHLSGLTSLIFIDLRDTQVTDGAIGLPCCVTFASVKLVQVPEPIITLFAVRKENN